MKRYRLAITTKNGQKLKAVVFADALAVLFDDEEVVSVDILERFDEESAA